MSRVLDNDVNGAGRSGGFGYGDPRRNIPGRESPTLNGSDVH